jgi:hypothetical protein
VVFGTKNKVRAPILCAYQNLTNILFLCLNFKKNPDEHKNLKTKKVSNKKPI